MKFTKLILCMVGLVILSFHDARAQKKENSLESILFHRGLVGDKVVCCFSGDAIYNLLPSVEEDSKKNQKQLVFFFPMISIKNKDCKSQLEDLANMQQEGYKVKIEEVKTPVAGIKVFVTFNSEKVAFESEQVGALGNSDRISFNFYKKNVLNAIGNKARPVKRYAKNETFKVVLDCGHGGKDTGSTSCYDIKEKDINLKIGTKVASLLKKKGVDVVMTRVADVYIPIDKRVSKANSKNPAVLISLHANSAPNSDVKGSETFYLKRELVKRDFSQLSPGLAQIVDAEGLKREQESFLLADCLHKSVLKSASLINPDVVDRKIKAGPFKILYGAEIPSVLVELGFLSNQEEAKLLEDEKYQTNLASGVVVGIEEYLRNHAKLL
ncbi:MAG: N-acetylmuramoyl-L-alanine amidase [candidate division TM6 bacterium GW2011_GWF2_32_72]|nr:MAG: N-acetylmuramoyl-L-alanine amidase [candidate division TM6 bacterium GW2011_GWF2_32_72]